jgi:hypothetical protein
LCQQVSILVPGSLPPTGHRQHIHVSHRHSPIGWRRLHFLRHHSFKQQDLALVAPLMDRTNVETVIVAGKVRKWKGQLLDVDLNRLRQQLEASRDYIFSAAGIPQNLFSSQ